MKSHTEAYLKRHAVIKSHTQIETALFVFTFFTLFTNVIQMQRNIYL